MLLTNRKFKREPPAKTAKSIYIFCEGAKREYQYFKYFVQMDSRVNVELYQLDPTEDNSPKGLLQIAQQCIISSETNPSPKYTFQTGDEVWIVLDVDPDKLDTRKPQIQLVSSFCAQQEAWSVVQSNPCFELWLYFHVLEQLPDLGGMEFCSKWKRLVNNAIKGGFDARRHPIFIKQATKNAKALFQSIEGVPTLGSTELFLLGESLLEILDAKLERVLKELEDSK